FTFGAGESTRCDKRVLSRVLRFAAHKKFLDRLIDESDHRLHQGTSRLQAEPQRERDWPCNCLRRWLPAPNIVHALVVHALLVTPLRGDVRTPSAHGTTALSQS